MFRVVSTSSPMITVDRATGTSMPVLGPGRGSRGAMAKESPTAVAPRTRDAVKPTSGSISRRTAASRMARERKEGRTKAFTTSVPSARPTVWKDISG